MPKITEPKKPVMIRLPIPVNDALIQKAGAATLSRGYTVTVQSLITEAIAYWLENGATSPTKGSQNG